MISIIIPCYKQAEFLPDAIESALSQTVPCEIIVVNDGSPDNTKEIAERYPVKLINQVNKGLASARNTGIMNATGDRILFLDADDVLLPNCVEKLSVIDADIVAPEFYTFGVNDTQFHYEEVPALEMFWEANRLPYFCLIKKSTLLEVGGYSPRMTYGYEDYHLWFDLLKRGKTLSLVREPLVNYRIKEHSMIHEAQDHHQELMGQITKDHA